MQFVYPLLTGAFFLALVPVLIHLINMMRHQRVKWAAMDFLLKSHKKHRHWVWLKQLLLLFTRMALFTLLVAMFAGLITSERWTNLFGGSITHHYILLDDSFSMSDRTGGIEVFDRAKLVIEQIAEEASRKDTPQLLSLLRYTRSGSTDSAGTITISPNLDIFSEEIDSSITDLLEKTVRTFEASEQSVGPKQALTTLNQFLQEEDENESVLVYIVSDFRRRDWGSPTEIKQRLDSIAQTAVEIHLVDCSRGTQPNLAVTRLEPDSATLAAGVPTFINLTLKNYSSSPATNIQVELTTYLQETAELDFSYAGKNIGLAQPQPSVYFEEIPPGEEVTRRAQIFFPNAGQHLIETQLPDDTVSLDNQRFRVLDVPAQVQVLVIDGNFAGRNHYYLDSVFSPSVSVQTGLQSNSETLAFLRDSSLETLMKYQSIYLLDIPALDEATRDKLKAYLETGRGMAIFLGSNSTPESLDGLHESGLIPAPIGSNKTLPENEAGNQDPDFNPIDHPLFGIFAGQNNPFLRKINVYQYFEVEPDWKPAPDSGARILGSLRNNSPFILEQTIGQGRCITCLSTIAPDWNSWAVNPSFIVFILDLQSYITENLRTTPERFVDSEIDIEVLKDRYRDNVMLFAPGANRMATLKIDDPKLPALLQANVADPTLANLQLQGVSSITGESLTGQAGVYEAWLTKADGTPELRRYALNVETSESDLEVVSQKELQSTLDSTKIVFHTVDSSEYDWSTEDGTNWQDYLLYAILVLLLMEQALAYLTSYHPPNLGVARK
ncbi:MAG: hypothetical protein COA78_05895 [Blastopirellula sp.]|nr:MAG: hypothetical protein COA78_05895 [Blastopirellula sp.]